MESFCNQMDFPHLSLLEMEPAIQLKCETGNQAWNQVILFFQTHNKHISVKHKKYYALQLLL